MNKKRIKIAFIALCVVGCFTYTVTTLLRALKAPYEAEKSAVSVPYIPTRSVSSDLPQVQMKGRWTRYAERRINIQSPISNFQSPISNFQSPISHLLSSSTPHSIGGGSTSSNIQSPISNIQSPISNIQYGTIVPLLSVNSSAFSVNRDLTETDGESVVGQSMRRIAPPDDGGSNIGGPGNIAPPGDEGELLGSPIGPVPFLFLALLALLYASLRKKPI